jgi:hypothetical protein
VTIPQYLFPPWSAPEGEGNSWIRNDDHTITVLPGAVVGATPGFDDGESINDAYGALPVQRAQLGQFTASWPVGTVRLGPYDYNILTEIAKPSAANLDGGGARLLAAAPGITCLYTHDTNPVGQQYGAPAVQTEGYIRNLRIDGTNAGANATGLDIGDGRGYTVDNVTVANFAGTGAVGLRVINRLFFTEYSDFRMKLINNTTAAVFDTNNANNDISQEYCNFDFCVWCQPGQQGLVLTTTKNGGTGVNWGGVDLRFRGNMSSQSSLAIAESLAFITLLNGARMYQATLRGKVEGNNGTGTPGGSNYPYFLSSDGTGYMEGCGGHICHSLGNSNGNSNLAGAEFSFGGKMQGDPQLAQAFPNGTGGTQTGQPSVPATTVAYPNTGPDFFVTVTAAAGGTCAVAVNNSGTVTIPASGTAGFYVNAGGAIKLTYGAGNTPSWVWQAVAQMSN